MRNGYRAGALTLVLLPFGPGTSLLRPLSYRLSYYRMCNSIPGLYSRCQ